MYVNESFSTTARNVTDFLDCGLPLGDCDILRQFKKVMLSLAIILNLATLVCIVILRKWKTFRERIFVNMMVANFLFALVGLSNDGFPETEGTPACIAQGFFDQILDMAKFLWVAALTIYLYNLFVKDNDTEHFEWLYTTVCWVLPISIACLPLSTDAYGPATAPYCWIKGTFSGTIWRITIFYIPIFGGLIVVMAVFVYMFRFAVKENHRYQGMEDRAAVRHRELVRDYLKPLTAYAVTFAVLNFFRFVNRMHHINNPPLFGLVFLHLFCSYSYGIILSTLFVITHGLQEFAPDKFRDGFMYYRNWCNGVRRPVKPVPYPVVAANPEPIPQPERAKNGAANGYHNNDFEGIDLDSD